MSADSLEFITEDQAGHLVQSGLGLQPIRVIRQALSQSGNAVFRVELGDGRLAVIRVSPQLNTFKYTDHNLTALRQLGLPVQMVLATGSTATGGSFVILNWIAGRDLMYELPAMDRDQAAVIARTVTQYQKLVGTLPKSKGFGWAPIGKNAASATWAEIFGTPDSSPTSADASPVEQMRGRLRALRRWVDPYFASIEPTCFLDDLTIKNVLVENGQLTGIIDVDFACYGDPLMAVGTTLGLLAAEVGGSGEFYRDELVRCWNPTAEGEAAIRFYAALWIVGMLKATEAAGNLKRTHHLLPIADSILTVAERAAARVSQLASSAQLLEMATGQHRAGNLLEARQLYQQVLLSQVDDVIARFRMGLLELQEKNFQGALVLIEQVAVEYPQDARFQFGLGEVLTAMGRWDEAVAAYQRVPDADPRAADARYALGFALQYKGDYPAAIFAYRSVVQIQPDFPDAYNNIGNCHKLCGELTEAARAYRQALLHRPNHAGAMSNLGTVLQAQGHVEQAIELLSSAIALEPDTASYSVNLAAMFCESRRFTEAESVLRSVLAREENNADAVFNLGHALHGQGKLREAVEQYRKAIAVRPDYADAMVNLGNVYKELGDFKLAATAYEAAMGVQPNLVSAINNAGCLLRTLGRLEEAEAVFRTGLSRCADHAALHDNLGNVLKDAGRLDEAIDCFRTAISLDPDAAETHSNLVYALSFQAERPGLILEECLRWNDCHAAPLFSQIRPQTNDRSPGRRLRIGYVSPDFRDHCQSLFTVPLLSHHDHAGFEFFCYSSVERPDSYTQKIAGYADVWRDVRTLDDAALCNLIRADGIDILVDLTMHMANGRPLLFARKPAPIQIAWLAYPGTTGVRTIDYRLSDSRLDPAASEKNYTERTVNLTDSFWCYDPLTDHPPVNELPALLRGYVTLGCLNNPCKLTDHTLTLWSDVMRELQSARLVLMAPPGSYRQILLSRFAARGIEARRIDFVSYRPRADYLSTYHQIDLGLDTFPYNGHTTSLDSFWMGVPVVTRVGETCVGRGGLSQLFQLGLTELASDNDREFVDIAVRLAQDLPRLVDLRRQLRDRLAQSPLMDGDRFSRNIEAIYRQTWEDYCASV